MGFTIQTQRGGRQEGRKEEREGGTEKSKTERTDILKISKFVSQSSISLIFILLE
jgi:hypothetical protein